MNIVQQIRISTGHDPNTPPGPPSRPVTTRLSLPFICLADAIANNLGKTRSAVVGEILTEALENAVKALPPPAARLITAEAMKINLRSLVEEADDPRQRHYFQNELAKWDRHESFDPEDPMSDFHGRPDTFFDGLIQEEKEDDDDIADRNE